MKGLLPLTRLIDALNERVGKLVYWLLLAATLISCVNAVVRKAFSVSSNAYLEAQWYLFAAVFMLGAGYTLLHDKHVRIDVLASRWSRRTQIWIDVIGIVVFLIPLCLAFVYLSLPTVTNAITSGEVSANPGGLIRWPLYILVPIGFSLLLLQAISELVKRIAFLTGAGPDPHPKGAEKSDEELLLEELADKTGAPVGAAK
jgi:TRAP-type mannitol/chloroaromatic compound transport system permease small subunit